MIAMRRMTPIAIPACFPLERPVDGLIDFGEAVEFKKEDEEKVDKETNCWALVDVEKVFGVTDKLFLEGPSDEEVDKTLETFVGETNGIETGVGEVFNTFFVWHI